MTNVSDFEEFKATRPAIEEALQIAEKKLPYISPKAPDGSIRNAERISTNIFHGAIAQIAVETGLHKYGGTNIEIYDRIRTDEFRNSDPFDIQCAFKNINRLVEVRSSYVTAACAGFSEIAGKLDCIKNRYNLLAEYRTSYKTGEARKDLFFQVYWTYPQNKAIEFYNSCVRNIPDEAESCFVVGFATKKLLEAKGRFSDLGQQGASFKLVPITDTFPCSKLFELNK